MASITDLSKIVYLSKAQYNTLVNDGTITVGNITVTYDTDNLYVISDSDIPQGGTSGQVLTKASSTDFDTVWATPSGGGSITTITGTFDSKTYATLSSGDDMYNAGWRQYCDLTFTTPIPFSTLSSINIGMFSISESEGDEVAGNYTINGAPVLWYTQCIGSGNLGNGDGSGPYLYPASTSLIFAIINDTNETWTGVRLYWTNDSGIDTVTSGRTGVSDFKLSYF